VARTPQPGRLLVALDGARAETFADGVVRVSGVNTATVFRAAVSAGVELHELTYERPDLESVFLELTSGRAGIQ
jgi:ABC-2 type transport system ATP-binding protein